MRKNRRTLFFLSSSYYIIMYIPSSFSNDKYGNWVFFKNKPEFKRFKFENELFVSYRTSIAFHCWPCGECVFVCLIKSSPHSLIYFRHFRLCQLVLFVTHCRSAFASVKVCAPMLCSCVCVWEYEKESEYFFSSCRRIDIRVLGNCFSLPIFHYIRALKTTLLHYFTWRFSGAPSQFLDAIWNVKRLFITTRYP